MKKFNTIRLSLVVFLLLELTNGISQTTFVVTDKFMGNPGSFDVIIPQAINSANAGNNVIVYFNAPGLCQINNITPGITIFNGSILLDKHPSATVPQGFESSPLIPPSLLNAAIAIGSNAPTTSITVNNLLFTNLHDISNFAIYIGNASNVIVQNCRFDGLCPKVYSEKSNNIAIKTNTFSNTGLGVGITEFGTKSFTGTYSITSNYFFDPNATPTYSAFAVWIINLMNTNINDNISVKSNTVVNYADGIDLSNFTTSLSTDLTFSLDIQFNKITSGQQNIQLEGIYKHDIVDNNTLTIIPEVSPINSNITIANPYTSMTNPPFGFDLVAVNSLGIPIKNNNNVFLTAVPSPTSFNVVTYRSIITFGDLNNTIAGLNLPGRVTSTNGKATIIRQNKIISNSNGNPVFPTPDLPITLVYGPNPLGNGGIPKPILNQAYITTVGLNKFLNVNFGTPGLNSINGVFAIDFYKSNANGDLLDYINSYTITSLVASYLSTVIIPNTVILNNNDRIAVTVTSIGNLSANPLGTSEASFIYIPTCPQIVSLTHISIPGGPCQKFEVNANIAGYVGAACPSSSLTASWDFGDGTGTFTNCADGGGAAFSHLYTSSGTYTASLTITGPGTCVTTATQVITATCNPFPCSDCISSFAPIAGKKYMVSAWVKENSATQSTTTYMNPSISIQFTPTATSPVFSATGQIIDGWQRLEGEFLIPPATTNIGIKLDCNSGDCFFDDIRVFPFDGSMKSYVYDPVNMRLVAELDERNYATLYEYDEEGKLIRVKKETEKGKMTIQENRNNTKKP